MSTIGSGVIASVAAQSVSERQVVSKRNTESREADRLRRQLADKFSPTNSQVEESGAAAAVEGDEESPADAKDRERQRQRQRHAERTMPMHDAAGHIDIQA